MKPIKRDLLEFFDFQINGKSYSLTVQQKSKNKNS